MNKSLIAALAGILTIVTSSAVSPTADAARRPYVGIWGANSKIEEPRFVRVTTHKQMEALKQTDSSAARRLRGRIRNLGRTGRVRPRPLPVREPQPGWEGRRSARGLPRPDLPVIICTGYSESMDEEKARQIGAKSLLGKPLDLARLAIALREALGD